MIQTASATAAQVAISASLAAAPGTRPPRNVRTRSSGRNKFEIRLVPITSIISAASIDRTHHQIATAAPIIR
jgi:hypothetical protein